jgi:hypothetical protein
LSNSLIFKNQHFSLGSVQSPILFGDFSVVFANRQGFSNFQRRLTAFFTQFFNAYEIEIPGGRVIFNPDDKVSFTFFVKDYILEMP